MNRKIASLLDDVLADFRTTPADFSNGRLKKEELAGESVYLSNLKPTYLRTLADITGFCDKRGMAYPQTGILEIGSFLGVVSVCLSRLGFPVTALDIPEYMESANIVRRFRDNNIAMIAHNLRRHPVPLRSEAFDIVVMCETLEHLNFNPLPVISEINRALKPKGLLYVTVPNIASIQNRISLLAGRSIHNPAVDFFAQLGEHPYYSIVGMHWREYTKREIAQLLQRMGFAVTRQSFVYCPSISIFQDRISRLAMPLARLVPSLRQSIVTFAQKERRAETVFHFCDATMPLSAQER